MASAVNGVLLVYLCVGLVSFVDSVCPRDASNGVWVEHNNDGRCILKCYDGYEPSGCHVLRYSHSEGKWNHDVPTCQKNRGECNLVTARTAVSTTVYTHFHIVFNRVINTECDDEARKETIFQHIQWDALLELARANLLLGPGFGALGLAALPIPARLQDAGVIRTATTTKGAVTRAITYAASSMFSYYNCEEE